MDTVTYPHAVVRQEIDRHWIDARVDVTEEREAAALFGVAAIPVAIAATADGVVLGRVEGFAEPAILRGDLEAFRAKR
jgi:thioredoxin-like negative regulator of GroEL